MKNDWRKGPGEGDPLPHKPTRESATANEDRRNAADPPSTERSPSGAARRPVDQEGSHERQVPHVTPNDEDAPVQDQAIAPNEVPVLPANASGEDRVDVDEQAQPIDPESMYDDRPERGKDSPPSDRVER